MGALEFKNYLNQVASEFHKISEPVKVVSNLDADGISACAIIIKALQRANIEHSITILHQLREKELLELSEENYNYFIFADLGSGVLSLIEKYLEEKKALVLDHHHPHGEANNVWHANPHLFGIDGSDEISAAGVCFMFARAFDKINEDMAHIALVGAIGDVQENNGFTGLNNEILEIGVRKGVIKVEKDLRFFGFKTRPLYKLLWYGSDLPIPGVTGSESGSIQFLKSIQVEPMENGRWRFIDDLDKSERQRLVTGIIMKRVSEKQPEDIFAKVYTIPGEEGPFSHLKEFSTLLNACGRLEKASVGIGACLGDPEFKKKTLEVYQDYKKEIVKAMRWYESSEEVIRENNYIIINAENNVPNTMIGTIASILSKAGKLEKGTFILSLARKPENITKVSLRVVDNPEGIHLKEILSEVTKKVNGECGGHQYAAGAIISTNKEQEFIEAAKEAFQKQI